MTDTDLMPFGIHKGKPMISVPAYYLIWLHKKHKAGKEVERYILMNWDVLQKEIELNRKDKY